MVWSPGRLPCRNAERDDPGGHRPEAREQPGARARRNAHPQDPGGGDDQENERERVRKQALRTDGQDRDGGERDEERDHSEEALEATTVPVELSVAATDLLGGADLRQPGSDVPALRRRGFRDVS